MSVSCGVECVLLLGCLRWACKRCTYIGSYDSATWPPATASEFEPVPRLCRLILAVYEDDLRHPQFPPSGGYRLNPEWVIKRLTYQETLGRAPPYLIYADHLHREIVLAIRGLSLVKESDYKLMLDNRLGMQMFDGGYVHHGLLKSAIWILNEESETLRRLWVDNGSSYKMVFTGHSLGSGVAALLTVIVVNHLDLLGGIPRSNVRCFSVAPARCMSLNLAVKYADVIHSVVLQDDFLPRTPTPLEDIFKSIFCLPCLLFVVCFWDTFIPEGRKLRDFRRLYAPGRMYHIVERKFCRCARYPPEVRTAIPVDGRFEHIVLSCNATQDHAIIWIEREAEKALNRMRDNNSETITTAPKVQKFKRMHTLQKEHRDALERALSLNIPHAVNAPEDEPSTSKEESVGGEDATESSENEAKAKSVSCGGRTNWNAVVGKILKKNESGEFLLKNFTIAPQ
ncbi:Sn1-specific diacylglycerol lipase alpha [Camellia lanceoleosa]|uniref:Sn1-specific diacylglycerol lipase alpha n=1 Tax=Camellia lanceoleosa TaxID=1840588 RepID=A0ACC0I0B8_9ERIC|nr:Sn1-specific diacylglycerol lipase alpha [Camellia lanceoleosa]